MSLIKFNLIKIDLGIVYQLLECDIPSTFKRNYKLKVEDNDIIKELNFFITPAGSADLGTSGICLGANSTTVLNRTRIKTFASNDERDTYYEIYKFVIRRFINDYKSTI